jgi:hypothetical protein
MTPVEAPDLVTERIRALAAAYLTPGAPAGEKPEHTEESAA